MRTDTTTQLDIYEYACLEYRNSVAYLQRTDKDNVVLIETDMMLP